MSSSLTTVGIAFANVACSVSLVLVNKAVFSSGFNFPMSLTCLHFIFTVLFYRVLAGCGFFELRSIPYTEAFKIAGFGVGSIGFMNISLHLNSVGFYQITKLAIVPCTLAAQAFLYNTHASRRVKCSLLILLLGLAMATVSDVQLNAPGFVLGVLAIVTTTIFQIWQGSKQKELEVSATQLQAAVSFWQASQSLAAALALENLCVRLPPPLGPEVPSECRTALMFLTSDRPGSSSVLMLVLLTCFIALGTNFSSFCLIGRTSAITFQVVGHAKTCLVLAGGYLLWPPQDTSQLASNVMGVSVAMVGCILYGHLKMAEANARRDICDSVCPAPFLSLVTDPARYEPVPAMDIASAKAIPAGNLPSSAKVALRRGPTSGSDTGRASEAPPDPDAMEAGEVDERTK